MKTIIPASKRFEEKIKKTENCWLWKAAKDTCGYGKIIIGSRKDGKRKFVSAHRFSYELYRGEIPTGLNVLHKCDIRNCINPDHLYLGTQKENVRDAVKRGRWIQGKILIKRWNMKRKISVVILSLGLLANAFCVEKKREEADKFYVYTERGSRLNHYIPSGFMGDWGSLKYNPGYNKNPKVGEYSIQIIYTGERKQDAGWAGIYFQHPSNNWGDKKGGYNLSAYKKVTFWARGEKGGEYIDKFQVGGITGISEEGDTDQGYTDSIELTKDWKQYTIDLKGLDMTHIIGGFCFAINSDMNPAGAIFYLDEIVFEK